ncbi:MAG: hypothetical protein R3C68_09215 [Myxococcota bacterium]
MHLAGEFLHDVFVVGIVGSIGARAVKIINELLDTLYAVGGAVINPIDHGAV